VTTGLLSRGPRYRLDAEVIRDYALSASGLLAERIGGPSVKTVPARRRLGGGRHDWQQHARLSPRRGRTNLYRRSHVHVLEAKRSSRLDGRALMPQPRVLHGERERTNTPLQALVTLNDPQLIEAARYLAERMLRESGGDDWDSQCDYLTTHILARTFSEEERALAKSSWTELVTHYADHLEDARELLDVGEAPSDTTLPAEQVAAWTMLTNQLLNLDESLNK
jgi:hypothetical protein